MTTLPLSLKLQRSTKASSGNAATLCREARHETFGKLWLVLWMARGLYPDSYRDVLMPG